MEGPTSPTAITFEMKFEDNTAKIAGQAREASEVYKVTFTKFVRSKYLINKDI